MLILSPGVHNCRGTCRDTSRQPVWSDFATPITTGVTADGETPHPTRCQGRQAEAFERWRSAASRISRPRMHGPLSHRPTERREVLGVALPLQRQVEEAHSRLSIRPRTYAGICA